MKIALDIENGGYPGLFAFSACSLEMISSSPMEMKKCAISNVQLVHPYGERPSMDVAGRSRPWCGGAAVARPKELAYRRTRSDLGIVLWHSE
jgi:hypothetical protein